MAVSFTDFVKLVNARSFPVAWPGHYADGKWISVKRNVGTKASVNPNSGDKLIDVLIDKESIATAIEATALAKTRVARMSLQERLDCLERFRRILTDYQEVLETILRIEVGKPKWEAENEVVSSLRYLEWVAMTGPEILQNLLKPAYLGHPQAKFELLPIGPTATYLPFSTPVSSFVLSFAAAMLAGCPLLVSCSSHASLVGLFLALLSQEVGLPPSLLNIIFGNFSSFRQVVLDRRIAALIYTGSREHCDMIRSESRSYIGRQLVLQSGGKNAVIVHSSADLEHAIKCVTYGALKSAGQRCTSTSRVFVDKAVAGKFVEGLVAAFRSIKIGRTDTEAVGQHPFMGPLYAEKAVEKYLRFQTMANRESEKTLLWGRVFEGEPSGNFVTPSLHYLSKFDNHNSYQGNVLFSPDVAIYDYDQLDTAIDCINTTDAAFAVAFVGDAAVIEQHRRRFLAPNLLVNKPTVELDVALPLAGRLQSGHHRFHGASTALYLCYPQVIDAGEAEQNLIKSWPWPGF